jgi:hypothetical protein
MNWSYSHTNFMILGALLSSRGGEPLDVLRREKVLDRCQERRCRLNNAPLRRRLTSPGARR